MKNHKKWLSALAIIATVGLLVYWYIASTPYRQAERLIDAIEEEDVDRVREMLESGVDPDGLTASRMGNFLLGLVESSARRPISEACSGTNIEIVRLLLEYGASPNVNEIADWSPIRSVLLTYDDTDMEMLQLLVEHGADTTYSEAGVEHVFYAAGIWTIHTKRQDGKIVSQEYDEERAKGITELVKYLLDGRSVNIGVGSGSGDSLLTKAVYAGNLYLVEYLLEQGAYVHSQDYYNAMFRGYTEIAELLKPQVE